MDTPAAASTPSASHLAELIYIELIGRAFLRVDNVAVFKPDPAELARLSIELAAAFHKVERAARAASGPQNIGYDVQLSDLNKWDK